MDHFRYRDGRLYAEDICLTKLAEGIGTPFFCYSSAMIENNYKAFAKAIACLNASICYAVKANSNIAVVATLARLGAGADVVSGGEVDRALAAGIPAEKIVFSGVGKTIDELCGALVRGVRRINVESFQEIDTLSEAAVASGISVEVAVRVNPDVDAKTHDKISTGRQEDKFGIDLELAQDAYARVKELPGLKVTGVAVHIGSQLLDLSPFRDAYSSLARFVGQLRNEGYEITELDLGGGLGIPYGKETAPDPVAYAAVVAETVGDLDCRLTFEPGRSIVGGAGILVTQVISLKDGIAKRFCIVDGAMNDLIRPTLYGAQHEIITVIEPKEDPSLIRMDVVGPICESGDYLAKDCFLPRLASKDLLVVRTAGAYGAVMGSTYNARPLAPEVLVNGQDYAVVRRRATFDDMMKFEMVPTWLEMEARSVADQGE